MIVDITFVEVLIIGNEFTGILAELILLNYHYGGDNAGDNQYQCKCDYGTGYLLCFVLSETLTSGNLRYLTIKKVARAMNTIFDEEEVEGSYNVRDLMSQCRNRWHREGV